MLAYIPVEVPEVDVVNPKTLEGFVDGLRNVFWVRANHAVRKVSPEAELRGEEDLVTLARPLEPGSISLVLKDTTGKVTHAYHFPIDTSLSP